MASAITKIIAYGTNQETAGIPTVIIIIFFLVIIFWLYEHWPRK